MKHLLKTLLLGAFAALSPALSHAGSSEATAPKFPIEEVTAFADRVQHDLAARGARVAIVARTGRDPDVLPEGINYTHVAFWVYSRITHADGRSGTGYRVYNLYQLSDDATRSQLVQDTPADFIAGAQVLDAGILIPDPKLQTKLLHTIAGPRYAALHNPSYAVMANPKDMTHQNCTEHTLDVLMASLYDTGDRAQIKANIAAHFTPQPVNLGPLKRSLAPMASAALTTADHGETVATTTFGALARFMQTHDLAQTVYRITPDAARLM